jgi:uncharacterized protein YdhG (YjbR/CyaY superfamily)
MKLVDAYIEKYETAVKQRMLTLRDLIIATVPEAEEGFSYAMPSYKYKGKPLIYFAAYANHIGVYGTPSSHSNFSLELAKYKKGKGSVQFQHTEPFPLKIIKKMIVFRQKEIVNLQSQKSKK